MSAAFQVLISDGLLQSKCFARAVEKNQIAFSIDLDFPNSIKREIDGARIASRRHVEVVLQFPPVAIVGEVDALIDLTVLHTRVVRNIRSPLRRIVADEIVTSARQLIETFCFCAYVCANESHLNRCVESNRISLVAIGISLLTKTLVKC